MRLLIAIALVDALLAGCGGTAPPSEPARQVTMNGDDGAGGIIDPINVWSTYQPRGPVVARVRPGDTVTMLRRDGDGVLIRTRDGVEGWVTYSFIKELK